MAVVGRFFRRFAPSKPPQSPALGLSKKELMSTSDDLYSELKVDVEKIVEPLFNFSKSCLKDNGNFLPHAAVLSADDEICLVAATSGQDRSVSTEILPLLHSGLRKKVHEEQIKALGIAENVTITQNALKPTSAIKVLFEHKRGLTVALYLPFKKRLFKRYVFGKVFSVNARAEVNPWNETQVS